MSNFIAGETVAFLNADLSIIPDWFFDVAVSSFSISLAVNTVVTGLLVLRLYLRHREMQKTLTDSPARVGMDLRPLMSMIMETGMLTFTGQLVYIVVFWLHSNGYYVVSGPLTILYV